MTGQPSAQYPDVAYREDFGLVYYPPLGDPHFMLPNGLHDVVSMNLVGKRLIDDGRKNRWYARTFFGNKKIPLKAYDRNTSQATLMTGETVQLITIAPDDSFHSMEDSEQPRVDAFIPWQTEGLFGDMRLTPLYRLKDGSFVGLEVLYQTMIHSLVGDPYRAQDDFLPSKCDQLRTGIVRMDAAKRVVWRRTYMWLSKSTPEFYWGDCPHHRGQTMLWNGNHVRLLPDGNLAISFALETVRVNLATGLPSKPIDRLSIVDTVDVLSFLRGVRARMEFVGVLEPHASDVGGLWAGDAGYFRLQEYFFFPSK